MTSKEFKQLVKKAETTCPDIKYAYPLIGIGLKSEREKLGINRKNKLVVTEKAAIAFIRHQCQYLNTGWDIQELNEIKRLFVNFVEVF